MSVSTYQIKKNLAGKKIDLTVGDQMTPVEAEKFQKEFSALLASIPAAQFDLEIDSAHMKVLTPDMANRLEGAMALYKQAGFKRVLVKLPNTPVLKMQVSRIARQVGLTNMEVIH